MELLNLSWILLHFYNGIKCYNELEGFGKYRSSKKKAGRCSLLAILYLLRVKNEVILRDAERWTRNMHCETCLL